MLDPSYIQRQAQQKRPESQLQEEAKRESEMQMRPESQENGEQVQKRKPIDK